MFGNPNHLSILTMLLSKILQVKYEDLEGKIALESRTIPNETLGEKLTESDVIVRVDTTETKKIVLEVNIRSSFYETIMNRNIHYMEKEAVSGIPQNDTYKDLPTTILVNFNNFNNSSKKRIFDEYLYRNIDGDILTTKRRILNIDIVKCYNLWYNNAISKEDFNSYERDLLLLSALLWTNQEKEFKECLDKIKINKKIKSEIMEVLLRMMENGKLVGRYRDYEIEEAKTINGIKKEIAEQMEKELAEKMEKEITNKVKKEYKEKYYTEGRDEGIEQKQREMVINLYNQGVSLDIISGASGLSKDEIENIIEKPKNK